MAVVTLSHCWPESIRRSIIIVMFLGHVNRQKSIYPPRDVSKVGEPRVQTHESIGKFFQTLGNILLRFSKKRK